jgi:hypothetical protein
MQLNIVGTVCVDTPPLPVRETRLIVPEELSRAAGCSGELPKSF